MYKKVLLTTAIFFCGISFGSSNDFGNFKKPETLSVKDLYDRMTILGEIFETSANGERLYFQGGEYRVWRFPDPGQTILSNWNTESEGIKISLRHEWKIDSNGVLSVHIEQFESMQGKMPVSSDVVYGKKLREETILVKDLAPITWVVSSDSTHRVVVRLTPRLESQEQMIDPTSLPIALDNALISDNKGHVWASGLNIVAGKYMSIKTHLGTVAISFYPFPGAKEIGIAVGNYINLTAPELSVGIRNGFPFVAGNGRARVYGVIDNKKRSESRGSVYSGSGSNEKDFVESLKK